VDQFAADYRSIYGELPSATPNRSKRQRLFDFLMRVENALVYKTIGTLRYMQVAALQQISRASN